MALESASVFLERSSYRRRRMMDAIRLLAVFGTGLWMVPVLWPAADKPGTSSILMSHALFYIFGVWLFLIVLAAVLFSWIGSSPAEKEPEEKPE